MRDERVSVSILSRYYAACRQGAPRTGIERLRADLPMQLWPNLLDEKRPVGPPDLFIDPSSGAGPQCGSFSAVLMQTGVPGLFPTSVA